MFNLLVFAVTVSTSAVPACNIESVRDFFAVPIEVLEVTDIDTVEKQELVSVILDGQQQEIPFGRLNSEWNELKVMYKQGDCIIHFRTDQNSWDNLAGREGYLLVRNGKPIYSIITKLS